MNAAFLLIFALVGALTGWLGSSVVKFDGRGPIGDVVVGVAGSLFGGWLFSTYPLVLGNGFFAGLIGATLGAIILLLVLWLVRRAGLAR